MKFNRATAIDALSFVMVTSLLFTVFASLFDAFASFQGIFIASNTPITTRLTSFEFIYPTGGNSLALIFAAFYTATLMFFSNLVTPSRSELTNQKNQNKTDCIIKAKSRLFIYIKWSTLMQTFSAAFFLSIMVTVTIIAVLVGNAHH